jgi:hypothetical protein
VVYNQKRTKHNEIGEKESKKRGRDVDIDICMEAAYAVMRFRAS